MMFAGFRSRWTTPRACANATTSQMRSNRRSRSASAWQPAHAIGEPVAGDEPHHVEATRRRQPPAIRGRRRCRGVRGRRALCASRAQAFLVNGAGQRRDLDGDVALELAIARAKDRAHAAAPDLLDQLVARTRRNRASRRPACRCRAAASEIQVMAARCRAGRALRRGTLRRWRTAFAAWRARCRGTCAAPMPADWSRRRRRDRTPVRATRRWAAAGLHPDPSTSYRSNIDRRRSRDVPSQRARASSSTALAEQAADPLVRGTRRPGSASPSAAPARQLRVDRREVERLERDAAAALQPRRGR